MFRTELPIAPATDQLSRTARVLTVGSCFADSIGSRLLANKVEALVNPFGTVFQPLALARLLRAAAGEEVDWQQHVVEARGRWQSYDLHGSIGAESPVELLQHIQELVRRTGEFLRSADVVLLTLGTAWAYRLRETGELVNNCHKQPADLFVRELLTPDEIINALAETHAYLRRINPKLRFVLTVSPVRHLKDTLPLNAVSKSVLRVATHIVSDLLPGVAYFPAYELLVDDLRDYRFYAADMLHPSEVAEDYIWEKFARTYFDAEFGRFRKEWAGVQQSLGHRPLHAGAPEHRQFLESTLHKLEQLSLRRVEVSDELQTVRTQLAALPEPRQPEPAVEVEDDEERIDIGEGSAVSVVERPIDPTPTVADEADEALASALGKAGESRPPRLSPEEFRSQRANRSGRPERGRRDGWDKGRHTVPSENEQFQSTEAFVGELPAEPLSSVESVESDITIATQPLEQAAASAENTLEVVGGQKPVKKKKRRSRGGAKRTARKHALRLAAESGQENVGTEATTADVTDTTAPEPEAAAEIRKPSVITKSVPVKRGGRRDEAGRVPRVPLFAAPQPAAEPDFEPVLQEVGVTADAELPSLPATEVVEIPAILESALDVSLETATGSSRNSRNRKKKKPAQPKPETTETEATPSQPVATAIQLAAPADMITEPQPVAETAPRAAAALPVEVAMPAQAVAPASAGNAPRRSSRKSRAVSGARAEKPAVDTPVVPVPDASQVRTQVAAGRMTGSSASLVEPDAKPKKAASAPRASKKPVPDAAPETEASQPVKKAAASKRKAPKAAPEAPAAPPIPEDALPQVPPAVLKPKAAKPKAAAKSKPVAPKATAAKPKATKPKATKKPEKPA
ncbi:GSCFA domain-containing protein [Hymenobacter ruricola]|uniref:GSCFA domain-containing protein n=1 Tax=Hymenobacter ruricola TaxID=2791023 RepID=A0ABS0HZB3_9BACT|nr:GSCFA domain-containing protein [Hymenobacter ruricola]MBF9220043.1 GSCFA domain-containing protein [Hymenobacter ruricola]